jgi:hypothetical protein
MRSSEQFEVPVGEELVMMSVDQGKYFSLNEVGATIWRMIETPIKVNDLLIQMQDFFDVSPERCTEEVLEFLRKLESRNLVHVIE